MLILASTSPARQALLRGLGIAFESAAPGVEETLSPGQTAAAAVSELARKKAQAVSTRHPQAWVLGADQLVQAGDQILGKPKDAHAALEQLGRLSGTTHEIVTGICLIRGERRWEASETTRITFYRLTEQELREYVESGEWEGCAGAYRIEGRGQRLMQNIEGDRTNVQGLPMLSVVRLLREAGAS